MKYFLIFFLFIPFLTHSQNTIKKIIFFEKSLPKECLVTQRLTSNTVNLFKSCAVDGVRFISDYISKLYGVSKVFLNENSLNEKKFFYDKELRAINFSEIFVRQAFERSFAEALYHFMVLSSHEFGHHIFSEKVGVKVENLVEHAAVEEFFSDFFAYHMTQDKDCISRSLDFFSSENWEKTRKRSFRIFESKSKEIKYYQKNIWEKSLTGDYYVLDEHHILTPSYFNIAQFYSPEKMSILGILKKIGAFLLKNKEQIEINRIQGHYYSDYLEERTIGVAKSCSGSPVKVLPENELRDLKLPNIRPYIVSLYLGENLIRRGRGIDGCEWMDARFVDLLPIILYEFAKSFELAILSDQ